VGIHTGELAIPQSGGRRAPPQRGSGNWTDRPVAGM